MRWATRRGPHVDRAACGWLIRRFVDNEAEFVFVDEADEVPRDAIPFDVSGAELSHHDGRCTFEMLLSRYDLRDPALHAIAAVVHDADLEDERFGAAEAAGLDVLVRGLALTLEDAEVLRVASFLFDGLYAFKQRSLALGRDPA